MEKDYEILAIERELLHPKWENPANILIEEAHHVYELQQKDILREIYFTEDKSAVLILECESKDMILELINELPLVKERMIEFDVMALSPYTGLSRIVTDS